MSLKAILQRVWVEVNEPVRVSWISHLLLIAWVCWLMVQQACLLARWQALAAKLEAAIAAKTETQSKTPSQIAVAEASANISKSVLSETLKSARSFVPQSICAETKGKP